MVQKLLAHRDCGARAGAISLVRRDVTKYPGEFVQAMASAALTDPCWQAQAAGLRLVDETPMLADLRAGEEVDFESACIVESEKLQGYTFAQVN